MRKLLGYALIEMGWKNGKRNVHSNVVHFIWADKPTREEVISVVEHDLAMNILHNSKLKNKGMSEFFDASQRCEDSVTIFNLCVQPLFTGDVVAQILNEDHSLEDFAK